MEAAGHGDGFMLEPKNRPLKMPPRPPPAAIEVKNSMNHDAKDDREGGVMYLTLDVLR